MITNEYINRAIDYILNHIDEEITVEDISNYCCFSRYYFSRIFKMETGESIYEFIKRVRMERSAFRLKVEALRISAVRMATARPTTVLHLRSIIICRLINSGAVLCTNR